MTYSQFKRSYDISTLKKLSNPPGSHERNETLMHVDEEEKGYEEPDTKNISFNNSTQILNASFNDPSRFIRGMEDS